MDWLAKLWQAIKPDPVFWEEYADWLDGWLNGD